MARKLPNGAIVSADEQWCWDGSGWKAILNPTSKAPGSWGGAERKEVAGLMGPGFSAMGETKAAAKELLDLVAIHGSLASAEAVLQPVAQAAPADEPRAVSAPPAPRIEVKSYRDPKEYEADAKRRLAQGWEVQGQSQAHGHMNMGRTVFKAAIFLPWAILRPSRSGEPLTITWVKNPDPPQPLPPPAAAAQADVLDQLRKLAELRDVGVVTEEEFIRKKEELLSRL